MLFEPQRSVYKGQSFQQLCFNNRHRMSYWLHRQSRNRKAGCFHNTVKTTVGGKKHLISDKTEYECCDHRHIPINMYTPI